MRQLPLQLAALMLALVFLVSCDRKALTPFPPAWSFDAWAQTTLQKPTAGTTAPLPVFHALSQSVPFTSDFIWESDKEGVLDKLPEIYALMDAAPTFATLDGLTIDQQGRCAIDGQDSGIHFRTLHEVSKIIMTILDHHETLSDLKTRDRYEAFALALIQLGTELHAISAPKEQATLIHYTACALFDKGYIILSKLDQVDGGQRLSRPYAVIETILTAASKNEARRRTMLGGRDEAK